MMTRFLSISLLLFLISCPNSGSNFDWGKQPHLGEVPPVVGRWFDKQATISIDPIIYNAKGDTTPIPDYIKPVVNTEKTIDNICLYLKPYKLNYEKSDRADIVVKFYYAPWYKGSSSLRTFNDALFLSEKTTSTASEPPTRQNNYNGVAHINVTNKSYHSVVVWLNVYIYEDYKLQWDVKPVPNLPWQEVATKTMNMIIWHEIFHTVGLNDDTRSNIPGLMCYRSMLEKPSEMEQDVVKWLYQ